MENTAKIHIMGAAAVLVSGVKLEDWKKAENYAPETLVITDESGEPCFKIATGRGSGSINRYGICWGTYLSEEGYATVTVLIGEDVENKTEAVMNIMGSAFLKLREIEKKIPQILAGIQEKRQAMESHISTV